MALVLAITLVGMRFAFAYFNSIAPLGAPASPLVSSAHRDLPLSPQLQVHPHQDLQNYCAVQQREVTTYGWVDQQGGVIRVPIDRAMDMVLARGLPARPASEANPMTAPLSVLPTVPNGTDLQGQCGYLVESPTMAVGDEIPEP